MAGTTPETLSRWSSNQVGLAVGIGGALFLFGFGALLARRPPCGRLWKEYKKYVESYPAAAEMTADAARLKGCRWPSQVGA